MTAWTADYLACPECGSDFTLETSPGRSIRAVVCADCGHEWRVLVPAAHRR